jgi:hypothetical protein
MTGTSATFVPANYHTGSSHGWAYIGTGPGMYDKIIVWIPNTYQTQGVENPQTRPVGQYCIRVFVALYGKGQDNFPTIFPRCTTLSGFPEYPANEGPEAFNSAAFTYNDSYTQGVPSLIPGSDCARPEFTSWDATMFQGYTTYVPGTRVFPSSPQSTYCKTTVAWGGEIGDVECSTTAIEHTKLDDPPCDQNPCDFTHIDATVYM